MSFEILPDVIEYIDKYWKPNQDDAYIVVEKGGEIYDNLNTWFSDYPEKRIDVGPFIGIGPYGCFDVEENETRAEFLFLYDKIDNTKLKAHHLTLA